MLLVQARLSRTPCKACSNALQITLAQAGARCCWAPAGHGWSLWMRHGGLSLPPSPAYCIRPQGLGGYHPAVHDLATRRWLRRGVHICDRRHWVSKLHSTGELLGTLASATVVLYLGTSGVQEAHPNHVIVDQHLQQERHMGFMGLKLVPHILDALHVLQQDALG